MMRVCYWLAVFVSTCLAFVILVASYFLRNPVILAAAAWASLFAFSLFNLLHEYFSGHARERSQERICSAQQEDVEYELVGKVVKAEAREGLRHSGTCPFSDPNGLGIPDPNGLEDWYKENTDSKWYGNRTSSFMFSFILAIAKIGLNLYSIGSRACKHNPWKAKPDRPNYYGSTCVLSIEVPYAMFLLVALVYHVTKLFFCSPGDTRAKSKLVVRLSGLLRSLGRFSALNLLEAVLLEDIVKDFLMGRNMVAETGLSLLCGGLGFMAFRSKFMDIEFAADPLKHMSDWRFLQLLSVLAFINNVLGIVDVRQRTISASIEGKRYRKDRWLEAVADHLLHANELDCTDHSRKHWNTFMVLKKFMCLKPEDAVRLLDDLCIDVAQAIDLETGETGLACDDNGLVRTVEPHSQAHDKGIGKGDRIMKIGTAVFSKSSLDRAERGKDNYQITVRARKKTNDEWQKSGGERTVQGDVGIPLKVWGESWDWQLSNVVGVVRLGCFLLLAKKLGIRQQIPFRCQPALQLGRVATVHQAHDERRSAEREKAKVYKFIDPVARYLMLKLAQAKFLSKVVLGEKITNVIVKIGKDHIPVAYGNDGRIRLMVFNGDQVVEDLQYVNEQQETYSRLSTAQRSYKQMCFYGLLWFVTACVAYLPIIVACLFFRHPGILASSAWASLVACALFHVLHERCNHSALAHEEYSQRRCSAQQEIVKYELEGKVVQSEARDKLRFSGENPFPDPDGLDKWYIDNKDGEWYEIHMFAFAPAVAKVALNLYSIGSRACKRWNATPDAPNYIGSTWVLSIEVPYALFLVVFFVCTAYKLFNRHPTEMGDKAKLVVKLSGLLRSLGRFSALILLEAVRPEDVIRTREMPEMVSSLLCGVLGFMAFRSHLIDIEFAADPLSHMHEWDHWQYLRVFAFVNNVLCIVDVRQRMISAVIEAKCYRKDRWSEAVAGHLNKEFGGAPFDHNGSPKVQTLKVLKRFVSMGPDDADRLLDDMHIEIQRQEERRVRNREDGVERTEEGDVGIPLNVWGESWDWQMSNVVGVVRLAFFLLLAERLKFRKQITFHSQPALQYGRVATVQHVHRARSIAADQNKIVYKSLESIAKVLTERLAKERFLGQVVLDKTNSRTFEVKAVEVMIMKDFDQVSKVEAHSYCNGQFIKLLTFIPDWAILALEEQEEGMEIQEHVEHDVTMSSPPLMQVSLDCTAPDD